MGTRQPTKLAQAYAAWPIITAVILGLLAMGEMRGAVGRNSTTLLLVSADVADVKVQVATIEGMLSRWIADGNSASVAVPAKFTPAVNGAPCAPTQ